MLETAGTTRADIEGRLARYLETRPGYHSASFVDAGGSASLFKVQSPDGVRAIKVYDPRFLEGDGAVAEARRLALQKTLIGHGCPNLVQFFRVDEAEETAFVEMDFVEDPQLKKVLPQVPDSAIAPLISQLVDAVIFLEKLEIVHRDIKPENIHVSADFTKLTLIDLGVARELSRPTEDGLDSTDHGMRRPFIATAQYSSPEYLFRLDQPSPELWKGLSLYQVGAVLHDLINKRPLYQDEVEAENKWLIARAVLTKVPTFPDVDSTRLVAAKVLASRCLVKDLSTRLGIVDWSDFHTEIRNDPLADLSARVGKFSEAVGNQSREAIARRLIFDRENFLRVLIDLVRGELIPVCSTHLPFDVVPDFTNRKAVFTFIFQELRVVSTLSLRWLDDPSNRSAEINISSIFGNIGESDRLPSFYPHCVGTIGEGEEIAAKDVAMCLAGALGKAMDLSATAVDQSALNGVDLIEILQNGSEHV